MKDKLIVALDVDSLKKAKALVDKLYPLVKIFKVGSQLFTACGPEVVKMIHKKGAKVFLDLKFHDIPNTVAKAVRLTKDMGVFMVNIHVSGGKKMLEAAVSERGKRKTPIILAVTVLTSLDARGLRDIGIKKSPLRYAKALALLAKSAKWPKTAFPARQKNLISSISLTDNIFLVIKRGLINDLYKP